MEVLATVIREEKEIKGIQIEKEEVKLSLFDIEDPKDTTRKLLELINDFGKVAGYKLNTQKSVVLPYTKMKEQKEKFKNNSIYHHIKKNKIPRNKST